MTKRPLGRGLSALISTDQSQADSDEIREIQIDLDSTRPTAAAHNIRSGEARGIGAVDSDHRYYSAAASATIRRSL